jgi:hypothetical protein
VRLLTAHRILIATFVVFALFFGSWEVREWRRTGAASNALVGALSFASAAGFGLYLRSLRGKAL